MNGCILVVDDSRAVADSLARLLSILGYEARAVYGGGTALEALISFEPDMAFIDIEMPGLNGYELARRIRHASDGKIILVAHTGWSRGMDKQTAYDSGYDLHAAKPLGIASLNKILSLLQPADAETLEPRIKELTAKPDVP